MTAPARVLASSDLSASVRELKLQLGAIQESVRPDRAPLPTGIAELDVLLVGRGIPRGRLTEITGASGSGRTSMLRTLVTAAASGGRWVAYIDATRTLAPRDWAHVGSERAPLWIIRPANAGSRTMVRRSPPPLRRLRARGDGRRAPALARARRATHATRARCRRGLRRHRRARRRRDGKLGSNTTRRTRSGARGDGERQALRAHDHDHAGEGWKTPDD